MGKSQSKDEVKEVEAGEQSRKKDFVSTYCKAMRSSFPSFCPLGGALAACLRAGPPISPVVPLTINFALMSVANFILLQKSGVAGCRA